MSDHRGCYQGDDVLAREVLSETVSFFNFACLSSEQQHAAIALLIPAIQRGREDEAYYQDASGFYASLLDVVHAMNEANMFPSDNVLPVGLFRIDIGARILKELMDIFG